LNAGPDAASPIISESLVTASLPYVGQWNRLVSTTNWEKGRIIVAWREGLIAQGLAVSEYSDEAWSRLVNGVTGQHVGRLRRVFQRFGRVFASYEGLYWSHFQAAVDWQDAEMWLEGAVQNGWSVQAMREARWETLGKLEGQQPRAEDVIAADRDEDADAGRGGASDREAITGEYSEVSGPRHEGPDFGDDPSGGSGDYSSYDAAGGAAAAEPVELVRPFEDLPELPDDLAEAFDAMKLAILHHKTDGWQQVTPVNAIRALDALKALATAPSEAVAF
jgi:hypothetical protein